MADDKKFDGNDVLMPSTSVGSSMKSKPLSTFDPSSRMSDRAPGRFSVLLSSSIPNRSKEEALEAYQNKKYEEATRNAFGSRAKSKTSAEKSDTSGDGELTKKKTSGGSNPLAPKRIEKKTAAGAKRDLKTIKGGEAAQKAKKPTAENYRAAYVKKQRELEDIRLEKNLTKAQKEAKIAEQKKKEQEETFMRVRARELQVQIRWWRDQVGQGQFEDNYIFGCIYELEYHLKNIDPRYWV